MTTRIAGPQIPGVDPNQPFPQPGGIEESLYPPTSRYHGLRALTYTRDDGRQMAYLERRFLPDPNDLEDLREHAVEQGDRLDNLAYHYIGDPEQYWQIADANAAMYPEDLTAEVGRTLRITLPEGITGAPRA